MATVGDYFYSPHIFCYRLLFFSAFPPFGLFPFTTAISYYPSEDALMLVVTWNSSSLENG